MFLDGMGIRGFGGWVVGGVGWVNDEESELKLKCMINGFVVLIFFCDV